MLNKGKIIKIGAISDQLGLSRYTPRFYEKLALLRTNRAVSGIREYSEGDIARLKLIICFKESGIPFGDINQYLELVDQGPGNEDQGLAIRLKSKERLEESLRKIERSIEMLNAKTFLCQN